MKIEFNPWKTLVWFLWILLCAIFMIPTETALEGWLTNKGLGYDWLWVPLYLILWRVWDFMMIVRKFYEEMPNK